MMAVWGRVEQRPRQVSQRPRPRRSRHPVQVGWLPCICRQNSSERYGQLSALVDTRRRL